MQTKLHLVNLIPPQEQRSFPLVLLRFDLGNSRGVYIISLLSCGAGLPLMPELLSACQSHFSFADTSSHWNR